ncbi:hypothetical protein ONZ45_g9454 [Pleurotus djamor]|nr:hypothetical protein ONZ45_g9454 [Pleurotus djamor]
MHVFTPSLMSSTTQAPAAPSPLSLPSPLHQKLRLLRSTAQKWCTAVAQSTLVRRIQHVVHRIHHVHDRQPSLILERTDTIVIAQVARLDSSACVEEVAAGPRPRPTGVDLSGTSKRSAMLVDPMTLDPKLDA